MGARAPSQARWAWRILFAYSGIIFLAAALTFVVSDAPSSVDVGVALVVAGVGGGLLHVGLQLRARKRWAHRAAVGLATLQALAGIAAIIDGRWTPMGVPVLLLWLLLHRSTRGWIRDDDPLEIIDRRESQRARRILTPDEPSVTEINERARRRDAES